MAKEVYIEDLIMREFDAVALYWHSAVAKVIRTSPCTLPIGVITSHIKGNGMGVVQAIEFIYKVEQKILEHSALENGKPHEMAVAEAASIMKRRRAGLPV